MMLRISILFSIFILFNSTLIAQHQELGEKPKIWQGKEKEAENSKSLLNTFKNGQVHGHFRYIFMSTINRGEMTDYFGNAIGGGIRYETAPFYNFQFSVSGFYIFNIGSSDFTKRDSTSGKTSRYELALFDLEDPSNKSNMDRLEELYLKYNFKKSEIIFGKQLINTPFINLQDGRMRPTGVEGLWLHFNELKNTEIEGGYLYRVSPRSTVEWYGVGQSLGINAMGTNIDGSQGDYHHNVKSKGILMAGVVNSPVEWLKITSYNMFVTNVFNSLLFQADVDYNIKSSSSNFVAGFQYIRQDKVNDGGNVDLTRSFMQEAKSNAFSIRTGWKNKNFTATLNYTRVTDHGRHLAPREWGRESLYTFLPRERTEGFGDVHATMAKIQFVSNNKKIESYVGAGYYKMPDIKNFRLNKYGLPSYFHINAYFDYHFGKFLEGLDFQVLLTTKLNNGDYHNDISYLFNQSDLFHTTVRLNYHF